MKEVGQTRSKRPQEKALKYDAEDDDDDFNGLSQTPPKDEVQSSKKPRESDASASKQHPALTLTGWQITNTRDAGADSSMHISDPESEHSEQSSDDIPMQDEGNDSDMEDTDNGPHTPQVQPLRGIKPIPESKNPATPEPIGPFPRMISQKLENNCKYISQRIKFLMEEPSFKGQTYGYWVIHQMVLQTNRKEEALQRLI
ncbi:hypothetical protein Tco_1163895 [Tanacetum coccineum]